MFPQMDDLSAKNRLFLKKSLHLSFTCLSWRSWERKFHQFPLPLSPASVTPRKTAISCCKTSAANFHLLLNDEDVQRAFIKSSWGVKSVFLPDLIPDFVNPVTPDDIAALSEDPLLHSRIILTNRRSNHRETGPLYTLRLGPFPEDTWETLPASNWTLLVQGVERRVPQLRDLLDQFSFIPNWRVDDIQASYATTGGGVGPHVDNHDVFLIQAAGVRTWRVGYKPIPPEQEVLEPDLDVRVLKDGFEPDAEYTLRAGDALYVPPRFPHWGISQDDECVTLSVGFRAPAISNLLSGWVEHIVDSHCLAETFYTDSADDLSELVNDAGRISKHAMDKAFSYLKQLFNDDERTREDFFNWFAQEVSQRKALFTDDDDVTDGITEGEIEDNMRRIFFTSDGSLDGISVRQQTGTVFTYIEDKNEERCTMYIDGTSWPIDDIEIAKLLCSKRRASISQYQSRAKLNSSFKPLVRSLLSAGLLRVEDRNEAEFYD